MNKFEKGYLKIDFEQIVEHMEKEEKIQVLKSIAVSNDCVQWVLDYICGDDPDGWWSGSDVQLRQKFLEKVEQTQLGKTWLSASWEPWGAIKDKLKEIESSREMFARIERIKRQYDHPLHRWVSKEFSDDDCSHYVTTLADDKIKEVEQLILATMHDAFRYLKDKQTGKEGY
jgi:hypothetical protein